MSALGKNVHLIAILLSLINNLLIHSKIDFSNKYFSIAIYAQVF